MIAVAEGWGLTVDEGPEWVFLRLSRSAGFAAPEPPVAATGWAIAESGGKRRLVFELEPDVALTSFLVGQLILLHKRAELAGGVFRICGFSDAAVATLRVIRVADRFPNYATREDAVMGRLPTT